MLILLRAPEDTQHELLLLQLPLHLLLKMLPDAPIGLPGRSLLSPEAGQLIGHTTLDIRPGELEHLSRQGGEGLGSAGMAAFLGELLE